MRGEMGEMLPASDFNRSFHVHCSALASEPAAAAAAAIGPEGAEPMVLLVGMRETRTALSC